jgi:hypothetical protein
MTTPLRDVCLASLPRESLPALAPLRAVPGLTVALVGGRAWLRWQPDDVVLRAVLPIAGVILYVQEEGRWYRHGHHLPAFEVPAGADYRPLCQVLTPAPLNPRPPARPPAKPIPLALQADAQPRPATALRCGWPELGRWADTVPTPRLESLRAARLDDRALLLGSRLPPLATGERFWGESVLVPLGQRPDPDLPPPALREALGIGSDELLLLTSTGAEAIPVEVFQPLQRASLRLILEETAP